MLMHNAYVYNTKGKRIIGRKLQEDNPITTYGTKTINGKKYYQIATSQYVAAGNIDGHPRLLNHASYIYNDNGTQNGNTLHKKNESIATYGKAVIINGVKYYKIGIHQYIKVDDFYK